MLRPSRSVWLWSVAAVALGLVAWQLWRLSNPSIDQPKLALAPVDFAHDVAPIVFAKCSSCHRPGEAAPFSLLTYDDVRKRARQIVDVTQKRFMPPWLPGQGHETFANSRRLTDRELLVIERWVESGVPLGDQTQIPALPTFSDSWAANPPDLIVETPDFRLASQDRDVFRNFVVPIQIDEARWIQSIEIRPCNPRVTHHARLGVDSSGESVRRDAADPEPGYSGMAWCQDPDGQLVIWAPGMDMNLDRPGVAWRLYPNMSFVLHTHMQPTGKPETVKFRIGIRFANEAPTSYPAILRIGSGDIDIPAGSRRHVVTDEYVLPVDIDIHTIFPHAHSLCQELRIVAERPDGTREPLISIDHFDENWHDSYRFRHPHRLPRGTRLRSTFVYDNSDANPRNRNHPARRVAYGSNANDEMADVYLQATAVHADQRAALMEDYKRYNLQSQAAGLRHSLDLDPNNPWSQEGLAACYVGLGEPAKAVPILEKRLQTGPREVFPIVSLGMALLAKGDSSLAQTHFREAIALDGQFPLAWYGLGKALEAKYDTRAAEDAYRRVVELAPDNLDARLRLVELCLKQDRLEMAKEICTEALHDAPDMSSVLLKLGDIAARQKLFEESLDHYKNAQRLAPYLHPPKVLLAVACCANGELERGVKLLQEVRTENPGHPIPPLMLGQLAGSRRNSAAVLEYLKLANGLPMPDNWPQSHKQRFQVLLQSERFQLAQQLQDLALARNALTQWLKFDPDNKQVRHIFEQLPKSGGYLSDR